MVSQKFPCRTHPRGRWSNNIKKSDLFQATADRAHPEGILIKMAASRLQAAANFPASLLPVGLEPGGRPSLDANRRQPSVEAYFSPRATEFSISREQVVRSEGVRLEVGHAVDISEQIRRLEANWNSRELALDAEETVKPYS